MKYILVCVFLFTALAGYCQTDCWEHYLSATNVNALRYQSPYLWIGSSGGLASRNITNGRHHNYTLSNSAIPFGAVYSIDIDESGNQWLGGIGSIARKNMDSFERYDLPVSVSSAIPVYAIVCQSNYVWAATYVALYRFDGTQWQVFDHTNSPLPDYNPYQSMCLGTNHTLWVGTDYGLYMFDGSSWQHYTPANSPLPNMSIRDLMLDQNNNLWICTSNGLATVSDGVWQIYHTGNSSLPSNQINSIHQDSSGGYWIGTQMGLARFSEGNWTSFTMANSDIAFDLVNEVCAVNPDDVWVGTNSYTKPNILNRLYNGTWANEYPTNAALTTNEINTLQFAANGDVWIGSAHKDGVGGAIRFDGDSWQHYGTYNSAMNCPCAHVVHTDALGNTYVSTCLGLVLINSEESYGISQPQGYVTRIMAMASDQNNNLWTGGTLSGGYITKYNGSEWTVYLPSETGMNMSAASIIRVDDQNRVWIGCPSGLTCFDGQTWTNYTVSNGALFSNDVKDICFDDSGNIWVANAALSMFNGSSWTHYTTDNSPLVANDVCSLTTAADGSVWIGTITNGIYRFFEEQWTHLHSGNAPLPNNRVKRLVVDNENTLWIGFLNQGLVLYNPDGLVSENSPVLISSSPRVFCYPNPFNPVTTIKISSLPKAFTEVSVYNLKGQRVRMLYSGLNIMPEMICDFNGRDDRGLPLSSGIYLIRVKTPVSSSIKKLTLVK